MELPSFESTGTYEDLIALIVRLEYRLLARAHREPPKKTAWQRRFLEFPLNLVGAAVAFIERLLPNSLSLKAHLKIYNLLTNYKYHSIDIEKHSEIKNSILIYKKIRQSVPNAPILCLTSHPPVSGEIRDLNVGLMSAGSRAIRAIAGTERPCRVLVAIDSMALDTLSVIEEGLYAGVMGFYDLGLDRYPRTRNGAQRILFRTLHYERSAFRLSQSLRRGDNIVLVISGGVNTTARLLYTIREFIWSLRKRSHRSPASVISEFAADCSLFGRFQQAQGSPRNPWRCLEAFFIAWLAGDPISGFVSREAIPACESGVLTQEQSQALLKAIAAFGIPMEASPVLLALFREEFARITPYRLRFYEFLLRRVLPQIGGVLIQPLDHSENPADPIQMREPLGILREGSGYAALTMMNGTLFQKDFGDARFFEPWMRSAFKS